MKRNKTSSNTDPNLPVILRAKVRDVLLALPAGRKATRKMIDDSIREVFGYVDATDDHILEAIEWNHSRNYIDYSHNHDASRDEWFITDKGRARA
jgi:hypothetical protein